MSKSLDEIEAEGGPVYPSNWEQSDFTGLTKRELFAAMAMQGILANPERECVKSAVAYADELIEALASEERHVLR